MDLSAIFYIATATVLAVGLFYFLSTGQGHATDKSKSDAPKPGESQFHRDVRKRIEKNDQQEQLRQRLIHHSIETLVVRYSTFGRGRCSIVYKNPVQYDDLGRGCSGDRGDYCPIVCARQAKDQASDTHSTRYPRCLGYSQYLLGGRNEFARIASEGFPGIGNGSS
jgi:hypothetical protein